MDQNFYCKWDIRNQNDLKRKDREGNTPVNIVWPTGMHRQSRWLGFSQALYFGDYAAVCACVPSWQEPNRALADLNLVPVYPDFFCSDKHKPLGPARKTPLHSHGLEPVTKIYLYSSCTIYLWTPFLLACYVA